MAPQPFSTNLLLPRNDPPISIENQAFALQVDPGEEYLHLHVALRPKLVDIYEKLMTEMHVLENFKMKILTDEDLKTGKKPHLGIALEDGYITFIIMDPNVVVHGIHCMRERIPPDPDMVACALYAAAHYYWHLHRAGFAEVIQDKSRSSL